MPATREFLSTLGRLSALLGGADPDADALRVEVLSLGRVAQQGRVDLWLRDVDDADAPVVARLRREGVVRLVVRQGASARELTQFAGLLARDGAGETTVVAGLDALGIWGVQPLVDASGAGESPASVPELAAALAAAAEARAREELPAAYDALGAALALAPARLGDETRAAVVVALAFAGLAARLRELDRVLPAEIAAAHWAAFDRLLEPRLATIVHAVAARPLPDAHPVLRHAADRLVPLLLERLGGAEGIDERRRCFVALLDAGGGVDTLIEALRDPRWYVVRNVALVLGELGARAAVRPLARCLAMEHRRVREAAAQALERIGTASAVHALMPALRDATAAVRRAAARAAGQAPLLRMPLGGEVLASRLRVEPELDVALELVTSLRAFGDADAITALARVVAEPESAPQGAAVQAAAWAGLAADGGARARPVLRQLAQAADAPTRSLARRVLAMLDA
jgi:hypothetical protein